MRARYYYRERFKHRKPGHLVLSNFALAMRYPLLPSAVNFTTLSLLESPVCPTLIYMTFIHASTGDTYNRHSLPYSCP